MTPLGGAHEGRVWRSRARPRPGPALIRGQEGQARLSCACRRVANQFRPQFWHAPVARADFLRRGHMTLRRPRGIRFQSISCRTAPPFCTWTPLPWTARPPPSRPRRRGPRAERPCRSAPGPARPTSFSIRSVFDVFDSIDIDMFHSRFDRFDIVIDSIGSRFSCN